MKKECCENCRYFLRATNRECGICSYTKNDQWRYETFDRTYQDNFCTNWKKTWDFTISEEDVSKVESKCAHRITGDNMVRKFLKTNTPGRGKISTPQEA